MAWSFARCWVLRDRTGIPGVCFKRERVPNGPLDQLHRMVHGQCLSRHMDFDVTQPRLRRREYRPYFENYTVDASILDRCTQKNSFRGVIWRADITNKDLGRRLRLEIQIIGQSWILG